MNEYKQCNYFEYRDMTEKLFYGVALTDIHMNIATEKIRQYIINGGASDIVSNLGIGLQITEKQVFLSEFNGEIKRRFVWLKGERKGKELTVHEIEGIGMFLKHGAFYQNKSEGEFIK